jgi:putative transposase
VGIVSIRFDDSTIKPLPVTDKAIGIDLGINSLVITSDGDKIANPKHFKKHYRRLRQAKKTFLENRKFQRTERKQGLK